MIFSIPLVIIVLPLGKMHCSTRCTITVLPHYSVFRQTSLHRMPSGETEGSELRDQYLDTTVCVRNCRFKYGSDSNMAQPKAKQLGRKGPKTESCELIFFFWTQVTTIWIMFFWFREYWLCPPVLWNRNYLLRFRFRFWLLKSYGSGSGSNFWKVMVPVPVPTFEKVTVPVPVPAPHLDHKKQIF